MQPLDYGPRPGVTRRRWFRRVTAAFVLITLLAGAGWRWGGPAFDRAKFLYRQRQCLRYAAPADRVVWEQWYPPPQAGGGRPRLQFLGPPTPDAFQAVHERATGERLLLGSVVFMHERRSPAGDARLVVVERVPQRLIDIGGARLFRAWVVAPATWRAGPAVISSSRPNGFPSPVNCSGPFPEFLPLRLFAGQPDPADPSHFTIAFESEGRPGVLDGWLRDGDKVELTERRRRG